MKVRLIYTGIGVFIGSLWSATWFAKEYDPMILFMLIIGFGLLWITWFFDNKKYKNWLLGKFKGLGNWLHNEFTNFVMYTILAPNVIFITFLAVSIIILFWPCVTFTEKSTAIILLLTGAAILINTTEAYARNRFDYYTHLQSHYKRELEKLKENSECLDGAPKDKGDLLLLMSSACQDEQKLIDSLMNQINYYENKKQNILKKIKLPDEQRDIWG